VIVAAAFAPYATNQPTIKKNTEINRLKKPPNNIDTKQLVAPRTTQQAFPTITYHSRKKKPHKSLTALSQLAEHQKVLDPLRAA
jgi:hypothetical protein